MAHVHGAWYALLERVTATRATATAAATTLLLCMRSPYCTASVPHFFGCTYGGQVPGTISLQVVRRDGIPELVAALVPFIPQLVSLIGTVLRTAVLVLRCAYYLYVLFNCVFFHRDAFLYLYVRSLFCCDNGLNT